MTTAVAHESSVDTAANVAPSVNKSEISPGLNSLATGESSQPPTKMTDATRNFQVSAFAYASVYRCIDNNSYCNFIKVGQYWNINTSV